MKKFYVMNAGTWFIGFVSVFYLILCLSIGCNKKEKVDEETGGQTTITFAFFGDIRNKPFGEALIKEFHKHYPSIRVRPNFIPMEYDSTLLTMLAGGTPPDIMVIGNSSMVDFASRGILLNLESFIDKDKEFQSFKDDIYPEVLKANKYNGVYYSVPFWTDSLVLFYNKDLFDKEGVKYPDGNWDWNKLLSAGKKLTKDTNNDGKIDQYAFFTFFRIDDTFGGLYQYIRRNKGELFNKDMSKCLIDSPESIEAIRWCFDLVNMHKITPSPFSGDERLRDYEQSFLTGKVAMTISGRWSIPWFAKAKFRWSCAPQPKGKISFTPIGHMFLGIHGKTRYPEECWKFLKFMMGKESQEIICDLKADVPIRISVANSPKFINWISRPEENKVFLEEMKKGKSYPYHFPGEKEWLTGSQKKLDLTLLGKISVESACKEIAKDYQNFISKKK